jgi:hypothetical protein
MLDKLHKQMQGHLNTLLVCASLLLPPVPNCLHAPTTIRAYYISFPHYFPPPAHWRKELFRL